jgi:tRNA A37 threonylcarbamoyladenosine modification protein TsaB
MHIMIKIENKSVEVFLLDGESVLDKFSVAQEHRLSEELLPGIDKMLAINDFTVKDIDGMRLQSDMGENFTTHRIAMATMNAFNWGKTVDN